jgi:putative membrane protein
MDFSGCFYRLYNFEEMKGARFVQRRAVLTAICIVAGSVVASAQPATLSNADKQFMKMAADANMTEAHVGQMAQDQGATDAVKDFGKTLVGDHTKAYQDLQAVATKTGENIPDGIDVKRMPAVESLAKLKGPAFDRAFARYEVQDHQKAIAAFKREADKGENADVKAYAQTTLPTLESHLKQAQELEKPAAAKK